MAKQADAESLKVSGGNLHIGSNPIAPTKYCSSQGEKMINVDRWIDLYSKEFEQIKDANQIRKFTIRAVELGAITTKPDGKLFCSTGPIHAELNGKLVGLRYSAKASN